MYLLPLPILYIAAVLKLWYETVVHGEPLLDNKPIQLLNSYIILKN